MHTKLIIPVLVGSFVAWRIYMRMRRTFGRQHVQPRRMTTRITVLALIAVMLLIAAGSDLWTLAGVLAGGAGGALLALIGLRHTQFETTPEGHFYRPHTYIGLTVTVVFLGKLIYDVVLLSHDMSQATFNPAAFAAAEEYNPLTLALSGAFIAYYLAYYLGVLRRSRQSPPAAPAIQSAPE